MNTKQKDGKKWRFSMLPPNCEECGETVNPFFERNELDLWNRYLEKTGECKPSARYWCKCGYSYTLSLSETIELLERWMKK